MVTDLFFPEMIELRHGLGPEPIRKAADLLLHFTERVLDAEPVAVEPDDGFRLQSQMRADKDAAFRSALDEDKAQGLIKLLHPQEIGAQVRHIFQAVVF